MYLAGLQQLDLPVDSRTGLNWAPIRFRSHHKKFDLRGTWIVRTRARVQARQKSTVKEGAERLAALYNFAEGIVEEIAVLRDRRTEEKIKLRR